MALAASMVSGCSKSDGPDGPTAKVTAPKATSSTTAAAPPATTSTLPATTTTAPLSREAQVRAAYLQAEAAYYDNLREPDPDDPQIGLHYAGNSLRRASKVITDLHEAGIHAEFPGGHPTTPSVDSVKLITASNAVVTGCTIDDARQIRTSDNKVVNDEVSSQLLRTDLALLDGTWKIVSQNAKGAWPDGKGCKR